MEGWQSYAITNEIKGANTFKSSHQFEPNPNSTHSMDSFGYLRGDTPVIVTRIGNHYYHHHYVYVPIMQNNIEYYSNEINTPMR
ncbi:MAG: hypothetical protein HFE54_04470 [Turicibacter sp.]|uniref:Uncharacterized protein n=1 Tax=Turicibacter faecis TaxID=2963365 RepID=A0ABN6Z8P0_9FIRM|nr:MULTISPECIES: hypothetical protein [unclassified Turicibacter]MCI8700694.1 hypothetical protein [Turicibacter sp.]BEH90173.1 hypothetical protein T23_02750 [Turicibacter sp. TC023]MCI9351179.1 hypothetical protein [Turicibacter sp.]MCU7204009.1 hypothetical protein [Turicibacter sp. TA25]MCU7208530.1 hypothetical protein [Turicibacter sp. 1E2]